MNLTYSTKNLDSKKPMNKQPIMGPKIKPSTKKTKGKLSVPRIAAGVAIGFLAIVVVTYLLGVPVTRSSVDFILGGRTATKFVYPSYVVSFDSSVPSKLKQIIQPKLEEASYQDKKKFSFTDDSSKSDVIITMKSGHTFTDADIKPVYQSYIVPVGHMYWVKDGISKNDLTLASLNTTPQNQGFLETLMTDQLGKNVKVAVSENLPDTLKASESQIGLIDIGEINQNYKLLQLDGKYFLDSAPEGGFAYSIVIKKNNAKTLSMNEVITAKLENAMPKQFSKDQVLKLNMTGVTAITRGLAVKTNAAKQYDYAAQKIADFLKNADLVHASNEVSFKDGCNPTGGMAFCSDPRYIQAMEKAGINIVEMTGNHNNDSGSDANAKTIQMYKDRNWDYFGGGLNTADSEKILYKNVKGTKIAFLGYNFYDTVYPSLAIAGKTRPGANSWSNDKVKANIKTARDAGAQIIIVDFQYQECYSYPDYGAYMPECYKPIGGGSGKINQERDFRFAIDNGADIVVGTQAHQPQTFEIYKGKPIYYGLGNLFFDQVQWPGTRQGMILSHYFYNGVHLTTKVTTTYYDSDMKTYVVTGTEHDRLLNQLATARKSL